MARPIVDRTTSDGDIYYGSVPNGSKPRRLPPLDPKNRPPREAFLDESEIEERQKQEKIEKKLYEPAKSSSMNNNNENIQPQPIRKTPTESQSQHLQKISEKPQQQEVAEYQGDDEQEEEEEELGEISRDNMCDVALQVDLGSDDEENVIYGTINQSDMNEEGVYAPAGSGKMNNTGNTGNTGNYSPSSTKGKSPDQTVKKSPFTKVTKEFTSPKLLDLHPLRRSKPHLHRHHKDRKSIKPQDYIRESSAYSEDTSVTEATLNNFVVDQLVTEICNDVVDDYSDDYSDDDFIRPVRRSSVPTASSPLKEEHFEENSNEDVKPKTAPSNVKNTSNLDDNEEQQELHDFTEEKQNNKEENNEENEESKHNQKESFVHYQSSTSTFSETTERSLHNTYCDDYVNNMIEEENHNIAASEADSRTSSRASSRNISSRNASGRNSSGRSHQSLNAMVMNSETEQMKNSILQNTVAENDVEESFEDFEEKKDKEEEKEEVKVEEEEKKEDNDHDSFEDDNEFV